MTKYKLTIFRQSRILITLFLFPVAVISAILVGAEFQSFLIGLAIITMFLFLGFCFSVGYLTVIKHEKHLEFSWAKKFLFNYPQINPIQTDKIHTLVIDQGKLLRKIKTDEEDIAINNMKFLQGDIHKLIYALGNINPSKRVRIIDSWDDWREKGYLKVAYKINIVVLLFAFIGIATHIMFKGFNSRHLLFVVLLMPQMFLYGQQMKDKLKITGGNNT